MEIRSSAINFVRTRGSGPQTASSTFVFPRPVVHAIGGLAGFSSGFHNSADDHHLGIIQVELDTSIQGSAVIVTATYGLRDWTGDWDDDYRGVVDVVVLAELEAIALPPPRGDLFITGIEVNQATQAFRSHLELDAANVMPDNSTPLVSRKATGLRLYVDYDAASGLPVIAQLSGEVEVIAGSGATVRLAPLAPIAPRRDNQIDRGSAAHTLNFVVPDAWCQGEATLRARVFDAANPASRSATFQMPVSFRDVGELRIVAVDITYTGQGMNVAPGQPAILASLTDAETLFPVPEVVVTGFQALTFGQDFSMDTGTGCGSSFSTLLDNLGDLVGDADEYVVGFLPAGIAFGPAIGCGRAGLCAAPVDITMTVAHELGHAFGRAHAPSCGGADPNFPQYGAFAMGSIGEFGFDTRDGSVLDPASFFDLMCGRPRWISPYNYNAIANRFPPVEFSNSGDAGEADQADQAQTATGKGKSRWRGRLFLGLDIARDRAVRLRPSFHYPAPPAPARGGATPFTADFCDDEGEVLACSALTCTCVSCDGDCWPVTVRDRLIFPPKARLFRVFEGRDEIFRREIPDAPKVELDIAMGGGEARLSWTSEPAGLWYLVQYRDRRGVWRALAPRTRDTAMIVPQAWGWGNRTLVRVLATEGIATGMDEREATLEAPGGTGGPTVDLVDVTPPATGPMRLIAIRALRSDGMSVPAPDIHWFDEIGAEIGRGARLDLGSLAPGRHLVRAVLRNTGHGEASREWPVVIEDPRNPGQPGDDDDWFVNERSD